MKYGELTLGQVEAIVNKIGGMDGVGRVLRDEVEIVAKATKRAAASLQELIKSRNFDWVNPGITDERFPAPERLWNDYKLFHFGEYVSSEEAEKRMQAEGYEPANSHELLLWASWNEQDWVVALGSVAGVDGNRGVLCLGRGGSWRCLGLGWWHDGWGDDGHFLGVRKSSGS